MSNTTLQVLVISIFSACAWQEALSAAEIKGGSC